MGISARVGTALLLTLSAFVFTDARILGNSASGHGRSLSQTDGELDLHANLAIALT